jgi:hypothetical protein
MAAMNGNLGFPSRRLQRTSSGAYIALLIGSVGACDGITSSSDWIDVELTAPGQAVLSHDRGDDGGWRLRCDWTMRTEVTASDSRATITWTDGAFRWTPQGAADPVATTTLTARETAELWGAERLLAGESHEYEFLLPSPRTLPGGGGVRLARRTSDRNRAR